MDSSILSKAYQQPAANILADVCALAAKMDNVIDLSVGDPNFTTPAPDYRRGVCQGEGGDDPLYGCRRFARVAAGNL